MLAKPLPLLLLPALLWLGAINTHGADVFLDGSDSTAPAGTNSSFNTSLNWDNNAAPSAGNDYFVTGTGVVSQWDLRTPDADGDYMFQGDSLTITNAGRLLFRTATNSATITINNLKFDGGYIGNALVNGNDILAGDMELLAGGLIVQISTSGRSSNIISTITGAGGLTLNNGFTGAAISLRLNNSANSYSGGTFITNGHLNALSDNAMGTGNVTMGANGFLTLSGGTTNNYFNDSASLILANESAEYVNLSFVGTDTIAALSFDGGLTFAQAGTWGAVGSGAQFTSAAFDDLGTGILNVIPEPGAAALLGFCGLAASLGRRRG